MGGMVCFLDLDGCLVDFVGGALRLHGKSLPPSEVRWDFLSQIGFSGIDDPAFWERMGRPYWAGLDWTAEGRALLAGLEGLFGADRVALMTSPCMTDGCADGKLDWVAREMPAYRRRVFLGSAKHMAAGPGKLLVDDHDANAERFRAHGGAALLVPRPWNERRAECDGEGRFDVAAVLAEARRMGGV